MMVLPRTGACLHRDRTCLWFSTGYVSICPITKRKYGTTLFNPQPFLFIGVAPLSAHAEIDKLPALPENTSELLAFGYGVSGTSTKPSALPTAMEVEDPDEQVVIFNAPPPLHSRKYVSLATQVEAGIDAALSHLAEAKLLLEQQDSHIRQSQTLHTILRVEGRLAGVMELARCHEMLMTNAEDLHPIPRSR